MLDTGQRTLHDISDLINEASPEEHGCLLKIHPMDLNAGAISFGKETFSIGRSATCDLTVDENAVSRRHTLLKQNEDGSFLLVDLNSTNGTMVNDQMVKDAAVPLKPGDNIRIGSQIYKFLTSDHIEAQFYEASYAMMTSDSLTGVWNRRYFRDMAERELQRTSRSKMPLSLLMMDLDHFKVVNDTYGHLAGDEILREFSRRIAKQLRKEDLLARYGGEEFSILLIDADEEEARIVANRCLNVVAAVPFAHKEDAINCTVSIGGIIYTGEDEPISCDEFFEQADQKLYDAKKGGRNRFCI